MICTALMGLQPHLTIDQLSIGDLFLEEPKHMVNCQQHVAMHTGKELAIDSMLAGSNGFAPHRTVDPVLAVHIELGMTQERRDYRANMVWARDLTQCLADRKRGRVNG